MQIPLQQSYNMRNSNRLISIAFQHVHINYFFDVPKLHITVIAQTQNRKTFTICMWDGLDIAQATI